MLLLICINVLYIPVFATVDTGTNLIESELYAFPKNVSGSPRSIIFLSNGSADVDLDAPASVETQSSDSYITNTQKINISLKSSKSITVKVSLYRVDGSYVSGTTKDLGTILKTPWTFTNLNQGDTYYFNVTNLGQQDVSITGTVSE